MSSIKKYIKETNEWVKFSDTTHNIGDLSSARNVKVDYGEFGDDSVNAVLQTHEEEIQKLKRNVSWLALHGGGGSGSGSGSGSSTKKASCSITINDSTAHKITIAADEDLGINLTNVKPDSDYETPWSLTVSIDGEKIYTGSKSLPEGSTDKTIPFNIAWDKISKFFEGDGKSISHTLYVVAKYYNESTQIESPNVTYDGYISIPSINCVVTVASKIDSTDPTSKGKVICNSTVLGSVKVTTVAKSVTSGEMLKEFDSKAKSTDEPLTYEFDILESFKDDGVVKCDLYDLDVKVFFKRQDSGSSWVQLDGSLSNFRTFVYGTDSNVYAIFTGLSYDSTKPTEVADNSKNLKFSFYAAKKDSTEFTYSLIAYDTTSGSTAPISILTNRSGKFDTEIQVNTVVDSLLTVHNYTINLVITVDKVQTTFIGYVKCVKSEYEWIKYSNNSTCGGRFYNFVSMNPLDSMFNESLKKSYALITTCTNTDILDSKVSSIVTFDNITSRSGRYVETDGVQSLRLYDTYCNIADEFKYLNKTSTITTKKLQSFNDFTFCICFKSQKYSNSDHIVFSLLNGNDITNGITIKADGVYVKNEKAITLVPNKVNTVHIVYKNTSSDVTKWSDDGSYYKIYVDGILSYMANSCPFSIVDGVIKNSNIEIALNGRTYGGKRVETCNIDVYGFEFFSSALNEIDILGTTVNNTVRTTYSEGELDFSIIKDILNVNGCDQVSGEISSTLYGYKDSSYKYNFDCVLADDGKNIPYEYEGHDKDRWLREVSSLNLPITYIDITKVHSTSQEHAAEYWSFDGFTNGDIRAYNPTVAFYYWDPTSKEMPISSDCVTIGIQGTSSTLYRIKNIQLTFAEKKLGTETVQDLFFVRKDWIPENSYVLKADIVDSSHANNASIGTFINEVFADGNSYGYSFDEKNISKTNIENTTNLLSSETYNWQITPKLRHTVEGFQTLLFVKFYGSNTFRCLGIYSFNIGRNAARNLGFENITEVLSGYTEGSTVKFKTLTNAHSPTILHDTKVTTTVASNAKIYWLENSDTQNYHEISSWTSDLVKLSANIATNPPQKCRFWHPVVGTDGSDKKLDDLFEIKYNNTGNDISPSHTDLTAFSQYVSQIAVLPIEGMIKNTPDEYVQHDIVGEYVTYTYDGAEWKQYSANNKLIANVIEESDVTTIDIDRTIKYYLIALLFGLIDNLDKNMSMRLIGNSKMLIDFYDMDTAFGLDNLGDETVTPTVGIKQVYNKTTIDEIDYPVETFDEKLIREQGQYSSKYTKYLPETYSNKLWLSLDSILMRSYKGKDYSLYTSWWFVLREYLDTVAVNNGYKNFIEYFCEKYFNNQIKFGSMIYNYDYVVKYINDFEQSGTVPSKTAMDKIHGIRKDVVKQWLTEHIDFLDSYFYWRGKQTYNEGNSELLTTSNIDSRLREQLELNVNSTQKSFNIKTEYPFVLHAKLGAEKLTGNALGTYEKDSKLRSVSGGTGKAMLVNASSLLKSIPLTELNATHYRKKVGTLNSVEEINLNGLIITKGGFDITDFYDLSTDSQLKKITFNKTAFGDSINLNLNQKQLLNITYIDINNSTNVNGLQLYSETGSDMTQHLEYLDVTSSDIESLYVNNQNMLKIPDVKSCENLKSLSLKNWTLDGIDESLRSNYKGPITFVQNDAIETVTLDSIDHITNFNAEKCQNMKQIELSYLSSITNLTITNCQSLTSLNIVGCPSLTSIIVNDCYSLPEINILSNNNLKNLDLDYLSGLTALNTTCADVKYVEKINLRNTNISGISYYDEEKKNFGKETKENFGIISDLFGELVFDFAPFEHLNSDGITLLRDRSKTSPHQSDREELVKAIRFPNNRKIAYKSLLDGSYANFTNLKNIYGHILVDSTFCYNNTNYPTNGGFFIQTGDQSYSSCPLMLSVLLGDDRPEDILKLSTIFDVIEASHLNCASSLSGHDDLSEYQSYLVDDFLSTSFDDGRSFDEFDAREWATNFSTSEDISYAFTNRSLNPTVFQYLLFRYAVENRNSQITHRKIGFDSVGKYKSSSSNIIEELPKNTFRYFGNTIENIDYLFKGKYHLTPDLMSKLSDATSYGGLGDIDYIDHDTLHQLVNLQTLGCYSKTGTHDLTNCISVISDENHDLFDRLDSVSTIMNFSPMNFAIRDYVKMPSSLTSITKSFLNSSTNDLIDISHTLSDCQNLVSIESSFGNRGIIYRPHSFSFAGEKLKSLKLDNSGKKYLVDGDITTRQIANSLTSSGYIVDSYDENDNPFGNPVEYTQEMFDELVNSIISDNTSLISAEYLYSNSTIPYANVEQLTVSMNQEMFKKNTNIVDASHMFEDMTFKYGLVGNMFQTLTSLNDVSYMFRQKTQLSNAGIFSDIPYKLFHTLGDTLTSVSFCGTDRFDSSEDLQQYSEFKSVFDKTYTPIDTSKVGSKSYDFDQLSSELYKSGLLNSQAYADVISNYLEGSEYVELSNLETLKSEYEVICPLASVDNSKNVIYKSEGLALVNTLSTIFTNLKNKESWEQHLAKIESKNHEYVKYNRPIQNLNYCFAGNAHISVYGGSTVDESNSLYNPFKCNCENGVLTTNKFRNTYEIDNSYSHNGKVWKLVGENYVFDEASYNQNNFNIVDNTMSVITTYEDPPGENSYEYNGKVAVFVGGKRNMADKKIRIQENNGTRWPDYIMSQAQQEEFGYICSPDLFRYASDSIVELKGVFSNCDMFSTNVIGYQYTDTDHMSENNVFLYNVGLTGRIPQNLLWPLIKLEDISKLFKGCYHVTGYEKNTNDTSHTYLIPAQIFKYANKIIRFNETFSNVFINHDADLSTAFTYLSYGTSNLQLNVKSIFSKAIWRSSGNIKEIFKGKYLDNIDYSFYFICGNGDTTLDRKTIDTGLVIGDKPTFEIFTDKNLIPTKITQTYYSNTNEQVKTISSRDYAWETATTDSTVTPSLKP